MSAAAASITSEATAPAGDRSRWYPPLPLWKLSFLLVLTCGVYSFFFVYRCAKDLRDHHNSSITPALYPFAIPFGIVAPFAGATLSAQIRRLDASGRYGMFPVIVGLLVFFGHIAIGATELAPTSLYYLPGIALYAVPWLLIQRQLNAVKAKQETPDYRTAPWKFTKLQIAGMLAGGLFWILAGFALWEDALRLGGTAFGEGEIYEDPAGRFSFRLPRDGWTQINAGYLSPDSELEMLGPKSGDFAIVYVTEQAGWSIEDALSFRIQEALASDPAASVTERREYFEELGIAIGFARISGFDVLDGRYELFASAFATPQRMVEIVVHETEHPLIDSNAEALAASLRPLSDEGF